MMKESDFKTSFQKKVKKNLKPLAILQYKQDASTVKGFPDTIFIFESIVVFIEFKRAKNAKFQPGQKEWIQKLNDNCHYAYVCHPGNAEEVYNEIKYIVTGK